MPNENRTHPCRLSHEAYCEPNRVVFVTICAKGRRPFVALPEFAPVVTECLRNGCLLHHLHLTAYCLMPDHFHTVLTTQDGTDLERFLSGLKWATSRALHAQGLRGPVWQRSYWDRHARTWEDVEQAVRYVLDNPVRKGLCEEADEWPYAEYLGFPW